MTNNVRKNEINAFFEKLKKEKKVNTGTIYNELCKYDCDDPFSIIPEADYWIEYFKDKEGIDVYRSPLQIGFVQFGNKGKDDNTEYIKLYIHLEHDFISSSVIKIFEFTAENDINQSSKVSDIIRSDDIVLRIKTPQEAEKIINFINNDLLISQNVRKTNPFLPRLGCVGYAFDNRLSYNGLVAELINKYYEECQNKKDLQSMNIDGFMKFVHDYSNKVFSNKEELNSFLNSSYAKEHIDRIYNGYYTENTVEYFIYNVSSVMKLIENNLRCEDTFESFLAEYESSINKETKEMMCFKFLDLLDVNKKIAPSFEQGMPNNEAKQLLDEFILYAYQKYNHQIKNIVFAIEGFTIENSPDYITRDNNFRNRFIAFLNKDIIFEITNNNVSNYIETTLGINKQQEKEENFESGNYYSMIYNALNATFEKYGHKQLRAAVNHGLKGDYSYFTNDYNLRHFLKQNVSEEMFKGYILDLLELDKFPNHHDIGEIVSNMFKQSTKERTNTDNI